MSIPVAIILGVSIILAAAVSRIRFTYTYTIRRTVIVERPMKPAAAPAAAVPVNPHLADVESALINLGLKPAPARRIVAQVSSQYPGAGLEELLRRAIGAATAGKLAA